MLRSVLLLTFGLLLGCDSRGRSTSSGPTTEVGIEVAQPVRLGGAVVRLRIAATDLEKAKGLMGTAALTDAEGMAFFYEEDLRMSFWMKDTPIDLDIAFIDKAGRILEVRTMKAQDTQTTDAVSDRCRVAVEMAAGWFARAGVKPGDQVSVEDLRAALRARGFEPGRYLP